MPPKSASTSAASTSAASVAEQQNLPPKDSQTFRQLVKFYESKQFKKAIRSADNILKRFPLHGETLSMKGLVYSQMKKKEEALDCVQRGLKANFKSHVCWHVYGLLQRDDHKYKDSVKSFQQALSRDPTNATILKDLSLLQIQLRDYDGYVETRKKSLLQKANQKTNWVGYAVALHLAKRHAKALEVIEKYEETLGEEERKRFSEEKPILEGSPADYEESELKLYELDLLIQLKEYKRAQQFFLKNQSKISDLQTLEKKKFLVSMALGELKNAEISANLLLNINSENYEYHSFLREAKGLPVENKNIDEKTCTSLLNLYDELHEKYPKSFAANRLPFDFLPAQHPQFRERIGVYAISALRKGIPNLFSDLRPLYADQQKMELIEEIISGYVQQLRSNLKFTADAEETESPVTLLWTLYYAGNHFLHRGQFQKALQITEEAIAHTPTAIDVYKLKAKIYKLSADYGSAYYFMDLARRMDTQDRYLNTKSVRYAWRAGKIKEAESTLCLFYREADRINPVKHTTDLQVMWYELAAADYYRKSSQYGLALKKYSLVEKHFNDFIEDQFDFHTYSIRKMTLRAYCEMIQFADTIKSHRFYVRAAKGAVDVYLNVYDGNNSKKDAQADGSGNHLSEEDKKKEAKKQKRAANKEKKKAEKAQQDLLKSSNNESADKEDTDPSGEEFLKRDPLTEAARFVRALQTYSPNLIDSHSLAIQVYSRKQRFLLVVKAVHAGYRIAADDPNFHFHRVCFIHQLDTIILRRSDLNEVVAGILQEERKTDALGGERNAHQLNEDFLKRHSQSFAHRFAAARVMSVLDKSNVARAIVTVGLPDGGSHCALGDVSAALDWLSSVSASEEQLKSFTAAALLRFPFTAQFGAPALVLEDEAKLDDTPQ